jgi:hypothetical protein
MNAIDMLSIPKLEELLDDIDSVKVGQLAFDGDSIIRYRKCQGCYMCALGHTIGSGRCSLIDILCCSGAHGWETVDTNSM